MPTAVRRCQELDQELDPESAQWLRSLAGSGAELEAAQAGLHALLLRVARAEGHRRARRLASRVAITGPELDDLAHQAAADALLAITGKLDSFRGESRFTTWAHAFVVFEVSSKVGRHSRRRPGADLAPEEWDRLPDRLGVDPVQASESRELVAAVRRAVEEELTERQRQVFGALVLGGVSLDVLERELDASRGAIYKTVFDARRKIRSSLVARGYLDAA